MSAAHWRKAMNAGSAARDWAGGRATTGQTSSPPTVTGTGARSGRAARAAAPGGDDAALASAEATGIWRGSRCDAFDGFFGARRHDRQQVFIASLGAARAGAAASRTPLAAALLTKVRRVRSMNRIMPCGTLPVDEQA